MDQTWYLYIVSNKKNGIIDVGIADNIKKILPAIKNGKKSWFAKKYGCTQLVWFKKFSTVDKAFERQQTLQGWSRSQKVLLIEQQNPCWKDLSQQL